MRRTAGEASCSTSQRILIATTAKQRRGSLRTGGMVMAGLGEMNYRCQDEPDSPGAPADEARTVISLEVDEGLTDDTGCGEVFPALLMVSEVVGSRQGRGRPPE